MWVTYLSACVTDTNYFHPGRNRLLKRSDGTKKLHMSSLFFQFNCYESNKPSMILLRSEMGVDVLVTGHTHKLDIWQGRDGGLYINPGSVSGCPIVLKHKVADNNIVAAKLAHTTMN